MASSGGQGHFQYVRMRCFHNIKYHNKPQPLVTFFMQEISLYIIRISYTCTKVVFIVVGVGIGKGIKHDVLSPFRHLVKTDRSKMKQLSLEPNWLRLMWALYYIYMLAIALSSMLIATNFMCL